MTDTEDDDRAEFHLFIRTTRRNSSDEIVGIFKGPREDAITEASRAAKTLTERPHYIPWARIALFEVVHVPVDLTALHSGVQ